MWGLLVSTIVTSAVDSLNPIAITQQFVLQGMVKKPWHIWHFIMTTMLTNLAGGYLAYFGLVALIGGFFSSLVEEYGRILFTAELILGIALLVAAGVLIQNRKIAALQRQVAALSAGEETGEAEAARRRIKSVSPSALIALGVGATLSELTTALPYFAFFAILMNYSLTFWEVTGILLLYNLIYTFPLMILYLIYRKAQRQFDRLYLAIKKGVTKWSNILVPAFTFAAGVLLIVHALSLLIK